MDEVSLFNFDVAESADFLQLLIRFLLNFITVGIIIHFFYYPKSKRRDYYFTFTMIAVSVFLLVFLLSSVKLKIGFALGIFAIFGIIRYRTESVPIREMTYLFTITAISVINALSIQISTLELLIANLIFVIMTWILESKRLWKKQMGYKLVLYDKIDLITPDKYEELKADLSTRTGLNVQKVEIEQIDFLRDAVTLKVYFRPVIKNGDIDDNSTPIFDKKNNF